MHDVAALDKSRARIIEDFCDVCAINPNRAELEIAMARSDPVISAISKSNVARNRGPFQDPVREVPIDDLVPAIPHATDDGAALHTVTTGPPTKLGGNASAGPKRKALSVHAAPPPPANPELNAIAAEVKTVSDEALSLCNNFVYTRDPEQRKLQKGQLEGILKRLAELEERTLALPPS
jgi:hypothetical protein